MFLARIKESSREPSAALWRCSIRWRDRGKPNFLFIFRFYIYLLVSATSSKVFPALGKVALLIEYRLEIKAFMLLIMDKSEDKEYK